MKWTRTDMILAISVKVSDRMYTTPYIFIVVKVAKFRNIQKGKGTIQIGLFSTS